MPIVPSVTFHSSGGLAINPHPSPRLNILLISLCRYISWSKLWGGLNLWYSYQMHSPMVHSAPTYIEVTTKHRSRAWPWFIKTEELTMRCNDYLHHDHCIFNYENIKKDWNSTKIQEATNTLQLSIHSASISIPNSVHAGATVACTYGRRPQSH